MVVHPQWPSNIRLVWPRMTQSRSTHSSVDDLQKAIMYLKIFSNGLGWLGGQQGRNNRINPAIFISITAVSGSQFVLYFTWRLVFTWDEKNFYHLNSQTDWRHCHIPRNHQLMDIEPWCMCGWHLISVKLAALPHSKIPSVEGQWTLNLGVCVVDIRYQ